MSPGDLLMMGNFHVPTNAISNPDTILLMDTLESFGLCNHINFPTHRLQNMLDLIITDEDSTTSMDTTQGSLFSDNNIVHFSIQAPSQVTQLKSTSYRKTKAIDKDLLKKCILLAIPHYSNCNSPGKTCETIQQFSE